MDSKDAAPSADTATVTAEVEKLCKELKEDLPKELSQEDKSDIVKAASALDIAAFADVCTERFQLHAVRQAGKRGKAADVLDFIVRRSLVILPRLDRNQPSALHKAARDVLSLCGALEDARHGERKVAELEPLYVQLLAVFGECLGRTSAMLLPILLFLKRIYMNTTLHFGHMRDVEKSLKAVRDANQDRQESLTPFERMHLHRAIINARLKRAEAALVSKQNVTKPAMRWLEAHIAAVDYLQSLADGTERLPAVDEPDFKLVLDKAIRSPVELAALFPGMFELKTALLRKCMQVAMKLNMGPQLADTMCALGCLRYEMNDVQEALDCSLLAIEMMSKTHGDPRKAYHVAAMCYQDLNKPEDAIKMASKGLELNRFVLQQTQAGFRAELTLELEEVFLTILGDQLVMAGRNKEAAEQLLQALAVHAERTAARPAGAAHIDSEWLLLEPLVVALVRTDRYKEALKYADRQCHLMQGRSLRLQRECPSGCLQIAAEGITLGPLLPDRLRFRDKLRRLLTANDTAALKNLGGDFKYVNMKVVKHGGAVADRPNKCAFCGRDEDKQCKLLSCARCRAAQYCCTEHQEADWKRGHKDVCKQLLAKRKAFIGDKASKATSVTETAATKPDSTHSESTDLKDSASTPAVSEASTANGVTRAATSGNSSSCGYCHAPDSENRFLKCGRCLTVPYCCKEHQRAHWKAGHKADCIHKSS